MGHFTFHARLRHYKSRQILSSQGIFFFKGLGERRVLETAYSLFLGNHSASPQATNMDPSGAGREVLSPLVEQVPPDLVTLGGKAKPFAC